MIAPVLWICGVASFLAATSESADRPILLKETETPGEYHLDTGELKGTLRASGLSFGFAPLHHVSTETELTSIMGLLNYYRVFTVKHRYGESMRALPSAATMESENTIRVHWPADTGRPFALTGIYHIVSVNTIDLITIVEAKDELPNFDVFIASYLSNRFPVSSVCIRNQEQDTVSFETAEKEAGVWQAFPRDDAAIQIIRDGRWTINPSPVDWAIRPAFFVPLIYRRNPETGLTIAMMARTEDCFAVFTPERDETHYSMYFSLFGKTIQAGENVSTRIRLLIDILDDSGVLQQYNLFKNSFN